MQSISDSIPSVYCSSDPWFNFIQDEIFDILSAQSSANVFENRSLHVVKYLQKFQLHEV